MLEPVVTTSREQGEVGCSCTDDIDRCNLPTTNPEGVCDTCLSCCDPSLHAASGSKEDDRG